jgi:hypothetical protein
MLRRWIVVVFVLLLAASAQAQGARGTRGFVTTQTPTREQGGALRRAPLAPSAVDARQRTGASPEALRRVGAPPRGPAIDARRTAVQPRVRVVPAPGPSQVRHEAVGDFSPLGAYGPLGSLGPLGDNSWNPSRVMGSVGEWSGVQQQLTRHGGPLSDRGSLGPNGPVARTSGFPAELRPGGSFASLGPRGVLGALGPLGPLGPVGAHGRARNANGDYTMGGRVQRTIQVAGRTFELVEMYDAEHASRMPDNDTSFMAVGRLTTDRAHYEFPFQSRSQQHVNLVVTPERQLDRFRLVVFDHTGREVVRSEPRTGPALAQLQVPAGTRLTARVELASSGHVLPAHPFRLTVVGSVGEAN